MVSQHYKLVNHRFYILYDSSYNLGDSKIMNKQEIRLIEDLLKKYIEDEFCDKTTKMVALSILSKLKDNE